MGRDVRRIPARSRRGVRLAVAGAIAAAIVAFRALAPGAVGHPFHPGADTPDLSSRGLQLDWIGEFSSPVYVAAPPDDPSRVFVVEQPGRVKLLKDGQTRTFLDVSDLVGFNGGERGFLSIAFAPDYATSGLFYVFYTKLDGDLRVDELKRSATDPDAADPGSRRRVLEIEHS